MDGLSFEEFTHDNKTLFACAFLISQIGELAGNISKEIQDAYPFIPWKSIRGLRNRITHEYENIDFVVLWGTITNSLPELKNQIISII